VSEQRSCGKDNQIKCEVGKQRETREFKGGEDSER